MENAEKSSDIENTFIDLIKLSKNEILYLSKINKKSIELFVKRDDLIHKYVSGNKIRKLKFNIHAFYKNKCHSLVTFGGAFSNHLIATAALCNQLEIPCIGIVRGDELNFNSNQILKKCHSFGMELIFVSRSSYLEQKKMNGLNFLGGYEHWFVPEGGANLEGIEGCKEIITEDENNYDYYVVAQGTTTTSLGIALTLPTNSKLIVVPVLKNFNAKLEMQLLLNNVEHWETIVDKIIVLDDFHFGGYAKANSTLNLFIQKVNQLNEMKVESIYTGKALFALNDFLVKSSIRNKKILFIHTGGLFKNK